MERKVLLSKYFRDEAIIAREDQLEMKPSSKGLERLKDRLGLKDWEMLYVGDGHDDFLAAKGANVFFALIAQGLVKDLSTVRDMKRDAEFGGAFIKKAGSMIPKFIVVFNYDELWWWFKQFPDFENKVKAVCFDLGDTLVVGGREEAYNQTDKDWPTWDVDKLMVERGVDKKLKGDIFGIRIENKWRKLGDLPGMNSSEVRIASFFLLHLFDLKEKDLVSVLYSEADKEMRDKANELSKRTDIAINTKTLPEGITVKELATMFPPEQFSVFIAAGLLQILKRDKREPSMDDVVTVLLSSFIWISQYRKHEIESYRDYCKVPKGLKELLDLLVRKNKALCIFTSKSRKIVETALAYEKGISGR